MGAVVGDVHRQVQGGHPSVGPEDDRLAHAQRHPASIGLAQCPRPLEGHTVPVGLHDREVARDEVAELLEVGLLEPFGGRSRRQHVDQAEASLVGVVPEPLADARLVDLDEVVDGDRAIAGLLLLHLARVGGDEHVVVRLRPAPHDRRQGVPHGARVPAADAAALARLDGHDLARRAHQ